MPHKELLYDVEARNALLYGVDARDPASIGIGVATITVVALAACIIPARRATRADPLEALRSE